MRSIQRVQSGADAALRRGRGFGWGVISLVVLGGSDGGGADGGFRWYRHIRVAEGGVPYLFMHT